jgi:hypothetical protein
MRVVKIVSIRAEPEMVWTYTSTHITAMQDVEIGRDGPVCHFPRHAMHEYQRLVTAIDHAVAPWIRL